MAIEQKLINQSARAVVAAINFESGLTDFTIKPKAINHTHYEEFLMKLKRRHPRTQIHIFQDNLKVHKVPDMVERLENKGIMMHYNLKYFSFFNPIEYCFSVVKHRYIKLKLDKGARGLKWDPDDLIK